MTRVSLEDIYLGLTRGDGVMSAPDGAATRRRHRILPGCQRPQADRMRQVRFEQLSFWLNPIGAIFTIGFSTVFLSIFESTAGKSTVKRWAASS